jgi:5'-3' exonuclease
MGVKGLNKIISSKEMKINDFKGHKMAIDTSIYLYKFKYGDNFIKSFFNQIKRFHKLNIRPIYVLDNKPNELKRDTLEIRKKRTSKIKEKIDEIENKEEEEQDIEKLNKLKRQNIKISKEDIDKLKELFEKCNVSYIEAPPGYDAEAICSKLNIEGKVEGVVSNDIDVLAYGGKCLITNMKNNNSEVKVYYLDDVLKELQLEYDGFVHMCLVMGCDFHKGEYKYGPKKSLKAVKEGKFKTEEYKELSKIFTDIETEEDIKIKQIDILSNAKDIFALINNK